ncbi:formyltransferase family protein [Bdellovibrio sp. 22V]|uniref:formyltransferase family protein n=1 Tax=Bdellovibrio TaxID=958 RepID=UPI002543A03C|nr:formyltransferase family protein [Bdellovibrio sp. 22V]WII72867.1 formyltransferase family protein [Bdellovibrio sp. 22V]
MRTLLVTSAVTFVPQNYDGLVLPLAQDPHITALVVIDNRSWDIIVKALLLLLSGAAPLMGWQLLKNFFDNSLERKKKAFSAAGKKVWVLKDINSEESLNILHSLQPDLIVNARTRSFFKKKLLAIPKMGCINIHHGLLPDQRGLMCDFWAHLFDTSFGFSIHEMTSKLDDGALLKVVEVHSDKSNYLESLATGASLEANATAEVLRQIAAEKTVRGVENTRTPQTVYRTNPQLRDFYKLRSKGTRI